MASAKVGKTLRLVLSELSQLVTGFSYCFENEMRPWCNKPPPSFNQLGPAFKRVHTMLQQFSMVKLLYQLKASLMVHVVLIIVTHCHQSNLQLLWHF